MKRHLFIVVIITLLFTACSIEKRHYRKGFHVIPALSKNNIEDIKTKRSTPALPGSNDLTVYPTLTASINDSIALAHSLHVQSQNELARINTFNFDQNSKEAVDSDTCISVKKNNPLFSTSQDPLVARESLDSMPFIETTSPDKYDYSSNDTIINAGSVEKKPILKESKMAFIFGIFSLIPGFGLVFVPFAIIFAFKALKILKRDPEKYKKTSKVFAILAICFAAYPVLFIIGYFLFIVSLLVRA